MPKEARALKDAPVMGPDYCPACGEVFVPFLRGQIGRSPRWLLIGPKRPHLALICAACKDLIGWEDA